MSIRDYIFRCLGMSIVWVAITAMVVDSGLFIPADVFETVLAFSVVGAGIVATIVVWCGPEIVRHLLAPKPPPPSAADNASWQPPAD
jgi:hypothetical protein